MSMTMYQAAYICKCESYQCGVVMQSVNGEVSAPIVCLQGRNISNILENGTPKWEIQGERFRKNERKEN
jgi:hypothetical protein